MIGLGEGLIIGGAVLLIFGATQIPKLARSMGQGLKEFKKGVKEAKDMDLDDDEKDEKPEGGKTEK